MLTVDDQGPGIAPADLPHVFERFYRSSESRSMPGSGLGLAIVQQVVGRHAGAVYAGAGPRWRPRLTLWLPGGPEHPAARAPGGVPTERARATSTPGGGTSGASQT